MSWLQWWIHEHTREIKLHRTKLTNIHTSDLQAKLKIWIRQVDYHNVNILTVILHYGFIRCHHWGKVNEGWSFPVGSEGKESACNAGNLAFNLWVRKIPWKRECVPTAVFLPGEFHGQRSLKGYSPWGHKELDMTERLILLQDEGYTGSLY